MSTTHYQVVVGSATVQERANSRVKTLWQQKLCFYTYSGSWGRRNMVFLSVVWESCRQKSDQDCIARARFALQHVNQKTSAEHFWTTICGQRTISYVKQLRPSAFGAAPDLCGWVSAGDAARMLVDLVLLW
jgi:hypothetical protein